MVEVHQHPRQPPATPYDGRRIRAVIEMGLGGLEARRLLHRLAPSVVVGFGGYPSIPTVFAASLSCDPDRSARTECAAGPRQSASGIACAGDRHVLRDGIERADRGSDDTDRQSGTPGHSLAVRDKPYAAPAQGGPLSILVTGGSQGARILERDRAHAAALLPDEMKARLRIVQQCRAGGYRLCNRRILSESPAFPPASSTFFADMPERLAACHLAITRSGASTVAELRAQPGGRRS